MKATAKISGVERKTKLLMIDASLTYRQLAQMLGMIIRRSMARRDFLHISQDTEGMSESAEERGLEGPGRFVANQRRAFRWVGSR
jgi:hypothetical protein